MRCAPECGFLNEEAEVLLAAILRSMQAGLLQRRRRRWSRRRALGLLSRLQIGSESAACRSAGSTRDLIVFNTEIASLRNWAGGVGEGIESEKSHGLFNARFDVEVRFEWRAFVRRRHSSPLFYSTQAIYTSEVETGLASEWTRRVSTTRHLHRRRRPEEDPLHQGPAFFRKVFGDVVQEQAIEVGAGPAVSGAELSAKQHPRLLFDDPAGSQRTHPAPSRRLTTTMSTRKRAKPGAARAAPTWRAPGPHRRDPFLGAFSHTRLL
ncbi:hypothetical protein PHYPSEUDO_003707 [Phytophthora pseudosyringae]|uniref:Uncharacterized protein n=1 Tax=Phytophthora pseudosyringae TaxID=221518 RepID=A0A8T1VQI4_9STRA|nr:hypothetical protein PHYPSEUDO_003707 [Phytophthora pseudosyringae]